MACFCHKISFRNSKVRSGRAKIREHLPFAQIEYHANQRLEINAFAGGPSQHVVEVLFLDGALRDG
jgi:hypothetical protein